MTRPRTAMIFAAGHGSRMQPLSLRTPKPLLPLLGVPLLGHVLARLEAAGVEQAVLNSHHLAEQITEFANGYLGRIRLEISFEPELLETGGGLVKAAPLLGSDPIFVINGDGYWQGGARDSLGELASRWDSQVMDSLLLLQPIDRAHGYQGLGDFHLHPPLGRLRRRTGDESAPYVFCGIQILDPRILRDFGVERFSLNRIWDGLMARDRLFGAIHAGDWYHLSTPDDLVTTERLLHKGQ
ncbi:MAG: nucleotidyltransferase family protein [Alphaproteobacteria bacterium]|nr:nucleotidyltransferase family protein [Alphaproteobacteria bacterium]